MASNGTTITAEEIIAAIHNDPRFANPAAFEQVKPYLVQLPEILGAERLAEPLTFQGLLEAEVAFLEATLAADFGDDGLMRDLFELLLGQLSELAANSDAVLARMGMSGSDAILSDEMGLNTEVQGLYRSGDLSLGGVVRHNPGIFIPRT